MKPLVYVVFLLFGTLISTELNGQSTLGSILSKYDKADEPDSAYYIIDKYEKIYQTNEGWDSLVYLNKEKCKLYLKYKSIAEIANQIEKTQRLAEKYLTEDNTVFLDFLGIKSDFKQEVGEYEEAEQILDKIILIASGLKNDANGLEDHAKADKAFLLLRLGRVKESEALASSVYQSIVSRGDTGQIIAVLQSLTMANQWLNRYDKALNYNKENLVLVKKRFGEKHPNVGLVLSQMAEIYGRMGQTKRALEHYNEAKNIHLHNFKKSGVSRLLGNAVGNLGNFYTDIGEYRLALDHMSYSLELSIKEYGKDSWNNMWHYSVLSTAARLYGDYDQADYYIDRAFDLISKNNASTPYDYNHFLSRKAEMLYTRDKYSEALPMALEVYDFYQKNGEYGSTNDRLHILNLITDIYRASGRIEEALKWSKKNLEYHEEHIDPLSGIRVNILTNYLALLTEKLDSTKALEVKEEVMRLRNKGNNIYTLSNCIPDHELLIFSVQWVDFLIKMSRNNAAYKNEYFEFLQEFEKYQSIHLATIKTNSNLASNEQYIKHIYVPAINFLSESDPERGLLFVERSKRFSTKQILQSQLIEDENLPRLDYEMDSSSGITKDSSLIDVFFNIVASLDSVALFKDSLYKNDRMKYEKYFGIRSLSLQDIRTVISEHELMIEYYEYDSLIFAFYIDQENVLCRSYPSSLIDSLTSKVLESYDVTTGSRLRSILLPDELIDQYKEIIILPDGRLNAISFEQLPYNGKPLIYEKLIRYGLSASVLMYQNKLTHKAENKNQFLGLTPGFTRELKSKLESMYTDSDSGFYYLLQQPFLLSLSESLSRDFAGETYEELDATESVFKSKAQDYRILHIGTHGVLNNESPLFSKLVFARDSIEDGYLHTYELYGKNLNADLAVLSACSSGKERSYASEGIVSLSHAFTHAGCPSVLMTKWDVDEKSTSMILRSFYDNLRNGKSKSEALRDAKLSFLKNTPLELHDPYYWAGLVLIGDDSAMFSTPWHHSYVKIALVILLMVFLLFLGWKWWRK